MLWEKTWKATLCEGQSNGAWRSGRSHSTNLLSFLEELTATLSEGNSVNMVHWDVPQVCDKNQHLKLMTRGRSIDKCIHQTKNPCRICPKSKRQKRVVAKSVSSWKEVENNVFWKSLLITCVFSWCLLMIWKKMLKAGTTVLPAVASWTEGFFTSTDYAQGPKHTQRLSWFGMCLKEESLEREEKQRERHCKWCHRETALCIKKG